MAEHTDIELAQLIRQHLKSIGTDWEILEPFLNRVLKPWENDQVIWRTLFLHSLLTISPDSFRHSLWPSLIPALLSCKLILIV
jgi:hypothetical protein